MNIKKRETLLGVAAVICFVLFVGDRLIVGPLIKGWKERSAKISELEISVDRGNSLLKKEKDYQQQWATMKNAALPDDESEAEGQVLKSVNQWARDSRLMVTSLRPKTRESKDEFKRLEIRASCQGSMSEIGRFLYTMETSSTPLAIEDLKITARANDLNDLLLTLLATAPLELTAQKSSRRSGSARRSSSR